MLRGTVSVLAALAATGAWAAEPQNAAHAIAQKFAAPTETAAPAVKPADIATLPSAKAPAKPAAVAIKPAVAPVVTAAEAAKPERPPLDYEMEMLRQARADRLAKEPAQPASAGTDAKAAAIPAAPSPAQQAAPATAATPAVMAPPAAATAVAAGTPAPVTATAVAPPAASPAAPAPVQAAQPVLPATPAAAPQAAAQTTAPATIPATIPATAPTAVAQAAPPAKDAKPSEPATAPVAATTAPDKPGTPATLLLALETSSGSGKVRANQSFDPILCLNDTCYVSAGLKTDAVKLAKIDALKLKTSDEASQDSCKGMIACVYRNVQVPPEAKLQVLELGSATHDAAHASDVKPDKTCKVTDGNLTCDEPIATPDFKVWVVLEETARAAGVEGLEEAVAEGLPHLDTPRGGDK